VNTGHLVLPPNSLIFNYTDGLIESPDEDVFITEEELVHYLQLHRHVPVEIINKSILSNIQSSRKAKMSSDDITLLSIKIL
jgi:sigma-B regulation protein RsbU (phosphoserine phosphatase)